jgi:hypothetical protein
MSPFFLEGFVSLVDLVVLDRLVFLLRMTQLPDDVVNFTKIKKMI